MPTLRGFSISSTTLPRQDVRALCWPTARCRARVAVRAKSGDDWSEADLVDCIVAMPPQLFYTTQIPVSIWFFNKDKKQKGKTLFIDARNLGTMVTRKLRELTDSDAVDLIKRGDIQRIADTYNAYADGMLKDEKGFCAVVSTEEIARQDFILTPGRYVGIAAQEEGHGAVRRKDEASDRRVVEIIRKVARVRSGDWETAGKYRI